MQLDSLVIANDSLHFEVDADSGDEGACERVVGVAKEEGGFTHAAVADDEQLEHVVEVLIGSVFLLNPSAIVTSRHRVRHLSRDFLRFIMRRKVHQCRLKVKV